mmetsp:Transcript_16049/g.47217  ORF Transcript_16049/g.47217 Transcript_16049/m.47217 type:complete len:238 (+) Transcript_16049:153-866(+)
MHRHVHRRPPKHLAVDGAVHVRRARRPPRQHAVVDDAEHVGPAQCPSVLVRLTGHVPRDARVAVDDAARSSNIHLLVRRLVVPLLDGARPRPFQEVSREGAGIFPRRRPERQSWRRAPRERQRPSQSQGSTPLGVRETVAQRRVARLICQPAVVAPKGVRLRLPVDGTLGRQERLSRRRDAREEGLHLLGVLPGVPTEGRVAHGLAVSFKTHELPAEGLAERARRRAARRRHFVRFI